MSNAIDLIDFSDLEEEVKPYITRSEHSKIAGALRKVFARSEFAKKIRQRAISDSVGPRGGVLIKCEKCGRDFSPKDIELHHDPEVVEIGKHYYDYTFDELISRLWSSYDGIVAICKDCHKAITKEQQQERNEARKNETKV